MAAHQRSVFPSILVVAPLLIMSCLSSLIASLTRVSNRAVLEVDIDYADSWYREIFNYSREAENIRHLVLVMPESEATRPEAGGIFHNITFQSDGSLALPDMYVWALDYVYEAPEGRFRGEFEPGRYVVAAAFIAAPLSREEAGVGDDVSLWPGVTGGGASTDYETVVMAAGETTFVTFHMTDEDGWACPWLYVFDGQTFERRTEILRNVRGEDHERTEITLISPVTVVDRSIVIRVAEEKDEVTYIDALYLLIDGVTIPAEADQATAARVGADDGSYLIIHRDESYEFRFRVPSANDDGQFASVIVTGYYVPLT